MIKQLQLESLSDGVPVIPADAVAFYKHNCMVCLHHNGHGSPVLVSVEYEQQNTSFEIAWLGETTERLMQQYREPTSAVNFAACAIALMLVREMTEFTAVEQSAIGTTIDYYLSFQEQDDMLIFNHAARLEVSGILAESSQNTVDGRIREKLRRLKPEGSLPDIVAVVEFSRPWSKIVRDEHRP